MNESARSFPLRAPPLVTARHNVKARFCGFADYRAARSAQEIIREHDRRRKGPDRA